MLSAVTQHGSGSGCLHRYGLLLGPLTLLGLLNKLLALFNSLDSLPLGGLELHRRSVAGWQQDTSAL